MLDIATQLDKASTAQLPGIQVSVKSCFLGIFIYIYVYIYIYILMNRWTFTNETEILNLVEFITTI